MGDRCSVWGKIYIPSLIAAADNPAHPGAPGDVQALIDVLHLPPLDDLRGHADSVFEFDSQEVNYAGTTEIESMAPHGVIGIFQNSAGDSYNEGFLILDGSGDSYGSDTMDGDVAMSVDELLQRLRRDERKGILPKGYCEKLKRDMAPSLEPQSFVDKLMGLLQGSTAAKKNNPKTNGRWVMKHWKKLLPLCQRDPNLVAQILCGTDLTDERLLSMVRSSPDLAARVVQARPDLKDRRLELAATGLTVKLASGRSRT